MSVIYRKSFKGIDEVAFKTNGLPMRMMSYLLVVDGETAVDQLVARNPQLPSLAAVLQGLAEQGFLEVAQSAANVVDMSGARVSNGGNMPQQGYAPAPMQPRMQAQAPVYAPAPAPAPAYAPQPSFSAELEHIKASMTRDVSALLAADAAQVIQKIQSCRTKDDLFATMMGIKKIITIYADRNAADKFAARYANLSM
jgi:hypothetical protein